jgi:hypothetical protein
MNIDSFGGTFYIQTVYIKRRFFYSPTVKD